MASLTMEFHRFAVGLGETTYVHHFFFLCEGQLQLVATTCINDNTPCMKLRANGASWMAKEREGEAGKGEDTVG